MSKRSPKERRELARKGAEATNRIKAERRTLRDHLLAVLSDKGVQDNIINALIDKASKGDTKAFEVVRDTIGEKPVDKQEFVGANLKKVLVEFVDDGNSESKDTDGICAAAEIQPQD